MLPLEDPPDGGWGWMVVLAGFLVNSLTFGVLRSLGALTEGLVGAFEATTAQVSWVTGITLATKQFASPLGTAASTRYGARPVVMLGGFLSSLGLLAAAFSTTLLQLYLSLGFLTGLGWALAFAPTMGTLARYFSSRRSLAVGLALTGNGLASLALSPLLRLAADHLAWRGTLLAASALTLHLVPGGALLRPLALRGDPPKLTALFDLGLFAQRGFGAFVLGTALLAAGYFVPYVHLDAYGRALGMEAYRAAFVVSLAGLADALARLLAGCVADRCLLPPVYLLVAANSLVGVSLLFFPASSASYASLLALALLYGASAGSFATLAFGVLPELVGVGRVVNATGLCMMSMSVGGLLGPPLSGFLRDQTGDFATSFLVGGGFVLCASLVFLALPSPLSGCCSPQSGEMPAAVGHRKPPRPMTARRPLEI
ncbi:monocarboxylate transporter 11 [Protobothrops mucrosquamatus]|uniref:monocarboxylate transporter 11 n=1 Tax=Protobothrops mucrosquamatus TaxID=103944 RepID=UPI000775A1AC|nr:monocarboxylate transporter 11 [Protobothrops mucrosquamatus]